MFVHIFPWCSTHFAPLKMSTTWGHALENGQIGVDYALGLSRYFTNVLWCLKSLQIERNLGIKIIAGNIGHHIVAHTVHNPQLTSPTQSELKEAQLGGLVTALV